MYSIEDNKLASDEFNDHVLIGKLEDGSYFVEYCISNSDDLAAFATHLEMCMNQLKESVREHYCNFYRTT